MIGIILFELVMVLILFLIGLYFLKTQNTETGILFLSGDYSGFDTTRICRDTGKRIMIWGMPFLLGIIVAIFNPSISIKIAFGIFAVLVIFHIADMIINRNKKYKL